MKRTFLAASLLVVGFAALIPLRGVPEAHACSCADCDFVRDADVVVQGTVTGWDYERDSEGNPVERPVAGLAYSAAYQPMERPVRMTLAVESVHKGAAPETITVLTARYDRYLRAEGSPLFGTWEWPLEAGECFGLSHDPTGEESLFILKVAAGGFRLVVAPTPWDGSVDPRERYPALGAPYPPAAGNSPLLATDSSSDWVWLTAIGAGLLLFTLVLVLVGPRDDSR